MDTNSITIHKDNAPIYDITFSTDFVGLHQVLEGLNTTARKVCIVTDSTVADFHLLELSQLVKSHCNVLETFIFPAGECSKNLDTVNDLYLKLIEKQFDRQDFLIALGGGVVGDLTGFAASTFLRGISFIQIPTSLLAMVDSSIGGKTGVDYKSYKNMVGAFYQPKAVYMNFSLLKTLDDTQYNSGFGEIIKHGLIRSQEYLEDISDLASELMKRDIPSLAKIIYTSCKIKQQVVENDPTEKGERALLNFGHTIGHAVEKELSEELLHGECVALGMVAASYISWNRGYITEIEFNKITKYISDFSLPICISTKKDLDPEQIYQITLNDKKMSSGVIQFVLLNKIGNAYIDKTVTKDEMIKAIQYILS